MQLANYTSQAVRTESQLEATTIKGIDVEQLIAALDVVIGAGEVLDQIKKHVFYGRPFDLDAMSAAEDKVGDGYSRITTWDEPVDPDSEIEINPRVFHALMGIITEGAELAETLKKTVEGEQLDIVNVSEEIGDIAWYGLGIFADATGITGEQILTANIDKLRRRYPEKFNELLAQQENRNLVAERNVLEAGVAPAVSRDSVDDSGCGGESGE